jgi:glycosyltransferase involved in cell wall biosynthesis
VAKPTVTVLIDTYNHERFIEQAVVSVLEQDFPSDKMEVLVVDDGSTDRTPEIVRKFEPRLRLILKANGGQASAFNVGIAQAQGEFVAFLDGDDWWAPSKLREVAEAFEKNPGIGAVGHGFFEMNVDPARSVVVVPEKTCRLTLNNADGARTFFSVSGLFATSCMATRRKVLDRILPVPEELIFAADGFVSFSSAAIAGAMVLDRPLSYYRVHQENLYSTRDPERLRRRQDMQDCLARNVYARLSGLGISSEIVAALCEHWNLDSESSRLSRHGGKRWETFQAERSAYRLSYAGASFGYKLYKAMVLALTLLIPPRRFYQLKQWYAEKGLRRYREKVGTPVPAQPIRVLRQSVENENIAAIGIHNEAASGRLR